MTIRIELNKSRWKWNALAYTIVFVFAGLNYDNPDFFMYHDQYNNLSVNYGFEKPYLFLMSIGHKLGLSYGGFLAVQVLISLLFLHMAIQKITDDHATVLFLTIISPLALFVTQPRMFFACCIFFFAISCLLSEKNQIVTYIIFLFLASLIHNGMYLYFVFIIAKIIKPKLSLIIIVIYNFLANTLIANTDLLTNIFVKIDNVIPTTKTFFYFIYRQNAPNRNGLLAADANYVFWLIVILILLYEEYAEGQDSYNRGFLKYCNNTKSMLGLFLRCYIWVGLAVPFLQVNTVFERYFFYLSIYIYALGVGTRDRMLNDIRRRNINYLLLLSGIFGFFYIVYVNGAFKRVVVPMIFSNYLLGWVN